ncbi:MAG TPA: SDR family oxidoreductase [Longimicrobiales bacterium]
MRGRVAVVTGASRGIGRAVAQRLAGAGVRVVMVARGAEALRAAAAEIGGHAVPADVADRESVRRLAESVADVVGGGAPDILVNAAGAFELAPLAETDPASFDRQLGVNLRGPFLLIRAFLPGMLRRGSGHVVTLGSIAGRSAFPENGAYAASKFGVRGLHAVLDAELRGSGVRSTLIEPAATDTPLWDTIDTGRHPGLPPREAMLSADAVADAVVYALTRPAAVDIRNLILERA